MGDITGTGVFAKDRQTFFENVRDLVNDLRTDHLTHADFSAGLAIGTGSTQKVRIVNTGAYSIAGTIYALSAATEVAFTATNHDLAVSQQAYYLISLNSNGTPTMTMGAAVASGATMPALPASNCPVGNVLIATSANTIFNATTDNLDTTVSTWLTVTYENKPFMLGSLNAALSLSGL